MKARAAIVALALGAGALALAGCATAPPARSAFLRPSPMPVAPAATPNSTRGSVFPASTYVSLFQDHRMWRSGDLVTIDIVQQASAQKNDASQLKRQSSTNDSVSAFLGVPLTAGQHDGKPFSPSFDAGSDQSYKGTGQSSASSSVQGEVTAVVTRVENNGVLALSGRTNVNINGGVRTIEISGYARPEDIGPDNSISSNQIADMNVQYVGNGPVNDAHNLPWFQHILANVWPF